jgi:hypothetical protein
MRARGIDSICTMEVEEFVHSNIIRKVGTLQMA